MKLHLLVKKYWQLKYHNYDVYLLYSILLERASLQNMMQEEKKKRDFLFSDGSEWRGFSFCLYLSLFLLSKVEADWKKFIIKVQCKEVECVVGKNIAFCGSMRRWVWWGLRITAGGSQNPSENSHLFGSGKKEGEKEAGGDGEEEECFVCVWKKKVKKKRFEKKKKAS